VPTSRAREKVLTRVEALEPPTPPVADEALAASFASFATTVQNRLDNNGSGSPIALNGSLEAQVERALSQASRRPATYGGIGSPATALATTGWGGSVIGNGSSPALSTAQTVLVGEAVATQSNMLPALDALQPLSPQVDESDVAAYRHIVRAEVLALTTEFARPDQPRPVRVRVLFGALLGWAFAPESPPVAPPPDADDQPSGDLAALTFLLKKCTPIVPSAPTEDQVALQGVVTADAKRLFDLWVAFEYPPLPSDELNSPVMWLEPDRNFPTIGGLAAVRFADCYGDSSPVGSPVPPAPPYSFSERMIRADLLLPVLSHDSDQVAGALDAVGFGPGAQETVPIPNLQSSTDTDLNVEFHLPILLARQQRPEFGLTFKDLLDWASDLAGGAGYELLREAGQLGLDLLADQADELFWIVAALLDEPPAQLPELGDTQVQIELRSLARDLSALADLSN
jgi:hypothetical protein